MSNNSNTISTKEINIAKIKSNKKYIKSIKNYREVYDIN
ncbi:Hypothetical protein MLEA_003440 [Mycoplasma leachii 99/014/6]|nr:Hypothetical protein MLEA_003440 [Mycoplasma leachii 99/014/6]